VLYKQLGKTGLKVSIVGFGASGLGNEFGQINPAAGQSAVHRAIERGVNYFDVSPYYGRTLAETRLGEALRGRRHKVILATKAGRYGRTLPSGFDFSAHRIRRSIDESLDRLQTDVIDIFQLHDIEFGDRKQIIDESIPAMQKLKQVGKVRFIGITGYPLHLLKNVADTVEIDTLLSYCHYNLMDTTLNGVLVPTAIQKGLGLINASPLHMGLLTDTGAPVWHPAPKRVVEMAQQVAVRCYARGMRIADLAMRFALQNESVATTLVGMSSIEQVDMNLDAVGRTPDPELLAEVLKMIAPVTDVAWQEGRPENFVPGAVEKQS
jgi:L-galactose dehydrogenase